MFITLFFAVSIMLSSASATPKPAGKEFTPEKHTWPWQLLYADSQRIVLYDHKYLIKWEAGKLHKLLDLERVQEGRIMWEGAPYFKFSPDGRFVAIQTNGEPTRKNWVRENRIFILSVESGELRKISTTTDIYSPCGWSSDGRNFIFATTKNSKTKKYLYDITTKKLKEVPPTKQQKWMDDIFAVKRQPKPRIIELHGTAFEVMSWSPDGTKVMALRDKSSAVYILDLTHKTQSVFDDFHMSQQYTWKDNNSVLVLDNIVNYLPNDGHFVLWEFNISKKEKRIIFEG